MILFIGSLFDHFLAYSTDSITYDQKVEVDALFEESFSLSSTCGSDILGHNIERVFDQVLLEAADYLQDLQASVIEQLLSVYRLRAEHYLLAVQIVEVSTQHIIIRLYDCVMY